MKHYAKIKETPRVGSKPDGFKSSDPQNGEDLSISVMEAPSLPTGRAKTVGHHSLERAQIHAQVQWELLV